MDQGERIPTPVPAEGRDGSGDPFAAIFDEAAYLADNPDVAGAIARGEVASGYSHYVSYGRREGRKLVPSKNEPKQKLIWTAPAAASVPVTRAVTQHFEALFLSRSGGIFILGWMDDSSDPVDVIRVIGDGWRVVFAGNSLGRIRRFDVEDALASSVHHPYGYYGLVYSGEPIPAGQRIEIEIVLKSGRVAKNEADAKTVEDLELRDLFLSYVHDAAHFGNAHVKAIESFSSAAGAELLKLNLSITRRMVASPHVERFGRTTAKYDGSIIVCLYGKAEFLFIQAALYSSVRDIDRYEFIYVSNSPELAETLLKEAKASHLIYGVDITVVLLSGNAGFGAANNAAARYARSDRIMIVNPDVFPMDSKFAHEHSDMIDSLPAEQTKIFGAALYYDDGSLMHGGMYFEMDRGVSLDGDQHRTSELVRVEHYGKGTPARMTTFTRARRVPAVTGAFISCARPWFERLGGFTEDYVFGHYEDADLCLKSLQAGTPVWTHDLRLWHLEGKGSTRRPVHEGGSLINRWLFSKTWGPAINDGLLGQKPSHPAFAPSDTAAVRPGPASTAPPRPGGLRLSNG